MDLFLNGFIAGLIAGVIIALLLARLSALWQRTRRSRFDRVKVARNGNKPVEVVVRRKAIK